MKFKDRIEAGEKLSALMNKLKGQPETIVLGLPRGGVVTAQAVAQALHLPLDIMVVRKIGAPYNEELAIGAISQDGHLFIDKETVKNFNISADYIEKTKNKEMAEANRRQKLYRQNRPPLNLKNKTAVLVDDGIATGATIQAAIMSAKAQGAENTIVAIPVIAQDTLKIIQSQVDEIFYLEASLFFGAVGSFYQNFDQTSDEVVIKIISGS